MSRLSGYSEYKTVREIDCAPSSEVLQRLRDDVGVLQGQITVIEKHFHRYGQLLAGKPVHRIKNPHRLCEYQVRYPGTLADELIGYSDLGGFVARNQPH